LAVSDVSILTNWKYQYYNIDILNKKLQFNGNNYMDIAELEANSYQEEIKIEFIPVLGANLSLYLLDYDSYTYDFNNEIPMQMAIKNGGSWNNSYHMDQNNIIYFTNTNIKKEWELGFKIENMSSSDVPDGRYFGMFQMNIYIQDENGDFEEDPYYSRILEYGGRVGTVSESGNRTIFVNATSVNKNINLTDFYASVSSKEHVGDVQIYLTRSTDSDDAVPVNVCVSPIEGEISSGVGIFEFINDTNPTITIPFLLGIEGQGYSSSSFLVSDLGNIVTYVTKNETKGNPLNDQFSLFIKPVPSLLLTEGYYLPVGTYTATVYINAIVPD